MFPLEPQVPAISAQQVKKMIDDQEVFVVLDVRTEGEVARGKIEGSINIPIDQLAINIEKLLPDKNAVIVVYCLSGSRSVFVVEIMMQMGYLKVLNLTSGMLAWRANGYTTTV